MTPDRHATDVRMLDLQDIFGHGGPLERALPGFRVRHEQRRMAERVAAALADRETFVVEAGTGTGKTFAYLVPALLSGARVLISTGTRTLQDQLFSKDLPLVGAALGRPARVALLKGRANYLCRHRLGLAAQAPEQLAMAGGTEPRARGSRALLARIARWGEITTSGDLAEVRGLSDSNPVWSQVTATREVCLGARCPEISRCHGATRLSSQPTNAVSPTPKAIRMNTGTNMRAVSKLSPAFRIMPPSPLIAVKNSATTIAMMARPTASRSPATM